MLFLSNVNKTIFIYNIDNLKEKRKFYNMFYRESFMELNIFSH